MEEKGKAITIEIDEEEEELQALIATIEEEEDMEEDIQPMCHAVNCPSMSFCRKGKPNYERI